MQDAAQACLDHWQVELDRRQIQEEERAKSDTLLRASEMPVSAETLLRPASGNSSDNSEELLRPENEEPKDQIQRKRGGP